MPLHIIYFDSNIFYTTNNNLSILYHNRNIFIINLIYSTQIFAYNIFEILPIGGLFISIDSFSRDS